MSTAGIAAPPLQVYAQPWGGALTATFIASIIYGITVLQTFMYYNTYPNDRRPWKVLVAVVFVLDTVALGLFMYCMQYYLVLSWGNPEMTLIDVKPFPAEYIITTILVFIVQLFYINVVRSLHPPLIVTLTLLALSLTAFATGLILPEIQLRLHLIPTIVTDKLNHAAFNAARGTALACDVGVVAALCWLLRTRKSDAARANNMINVLMAVALQRGMLQMFVQAGEVIAYAAKPNNVYFLPFHVIVSRVYCTSLLATLNTRGYAASKSKLTPPPSYASTLDAAGTPRGGIFTSVLLDPPFLSRDELEGARGVASTAGEADVEAGRERAREGGPSEDGATALDGRDRKESTAGSRRKLAAVQGGVEVYELTEFERPRSGSDASTPRA